VLSYNTLEVLKVSETIGVVTFPDGRMDAKNAAAYLGLAVKTLAMMRCQGSGPPFLKRGRISYFQTDLDRWLAQARFCSTAEARVKGRAEHAVIDAQNAGKEI
jgi:hypothetical protein